MSSVAVFERSWTDDRTRYLRRALEIAMPLVKAVVEINTFPGPSLSYKAVAKQADRMRAKDLDVAQKNAKAFRARPRRAEPRFRLIPPPIPAVQMKMRPKRPIGWGGGFTMIEKV